MPFMFKRLVSMSFLLIALLQTGCLVRKAQLANFQSGELFYGKFTDTPGTGGNISVTMPSGEVLKGRYSAIRDHDYATFTFSNSTASGVANTDISQRSEISGRIGNIPVFGSERDHTKVVTHLSAQSSTVEQTRTVGGQGKAYAMLASTTPGSKLMMEVLVIYGVLDGHGWGEARTNDGKNYRVTF